MDNDVLDDDVLDNDELIAVGDIVKRVSTGDEGVVTKVYTGGNIAADVDWQNEALNKPVSKSVMRHALQTDKIVIVGASDEVL